MRSRFVFYDGGAECGGGIGRRAADCRPYGCGEGTGAEVELGTGVKTLPYRSFAKCIGGDSKGENGGNAEA